MSVLPSGSTITITGVKLYYDDGTFVCIRSKRPAPLCSPNLRAWPQFFNFSIFPSNFTRQAPLLAAATAFAVGYLRLWWA